MRHMDELKHDTYLLTIDFSGERYRPKWLKHGRYHPPIKVQATQTSTLRSLGDFDHKLATTDPRLVVRDPTKTSLIACHMSNATRAAHHFSPLAQYFLSINIICLFCMYSKFPFLFRKKAINLCGKIGLNMIV
jgi:hypothetical protein